MTASLPSPRIDGLQYALWSETVFRQMREGGLDAVHVTIAYHETFREAVLNVEAWNRRFERHADLILHARTAADVERARATERTAIVFGFQNPSPIEDDIGLVEVWHALGVRFMQLSYNNQSLLATGCYEAEDPGLTRMGREVIAEMNRVGLVVDMSHSAERSTLEAIERSSRPIAITHANPASWHPARRNKSDGVIRALAGSGGMLGFSLYPHHLRGGSACTLASFCEMIARAAEMAGPERLGIGSDLCQDQPDAVVEWMRQGRWTKGRDMGEGSADAPGFPPMPGWFRDNRDFGGLEAGLRTAGFDAAEAAGIMGGNWLRFFERELRAGRAGRRLTRARRGASRDGPRRRAAPTRGAARRGKRGRGPGRGGPFTVASVLGGGADRATPVPRAQRGPSHLVPSDDPERAPSAPDGSDPARVLGRPADHARPCGSAHGPSLGSAPRRHEARRRGWGRRLAAPTSQVPRRPSCARLPIAPAGTRRGSR